jgi:hypothetical protein
VESLLRETKKPKISKKSHANAQFLITGLNENEVKKIAQSADSSYRMLLQYGTENLETGAMVCPLLRITGPV